MPMKKITTILTILLFTIGLINAQSQDSLIKDIRTKYKDIKNDLSTFNITKTEIWNESTEGGQAIAYYDKDKLKLIEIIRLGETGKRITEYYFDKGKLVFVFDQNYEYNRPIYWDKKMSKENNDNEFFEPEKSLIKENRYYFNNEQLFLWLDNEKNKVDLTLNTNLIVGQDLISNTKKIKEKLKK